LRRLTRAKVGPVLAHWCPHAPTSKQLSFLSLTCREALYGGSAGGGKSDALLMAALQYVDTPGYAALLLRRTFADLALPGALMDRASDWLGASAAKWDDAEHTWRFPSGATITFGYLEMEKSKYRYQSAEFQFIGFDEVTQFSHSQYTWMFTRLRRLAGSKVPVRMRAASNPGGVGHDWVKQRFVDPHEEPERLFIPARLSDNPHLDAEEYLHSLDQLDAVTREQYLQGDWNVMPEGDLFKREWFEILPDRPSLLTRWVRYWDKAGTKDGGDWTAGVLMGHGAGAYYVLDVVRGQWSPAERNAVIRQTASVDALACPVYSVWTEQEGGSGGKESALATITDLAGYDVHAETVTGSKIVRATPYAAQCEVGNVKLIRGDWNGAYITEVCAFPEGPHDDQVDASSGAFAKLATKHHESGQLAGSPWRR
jgi:predicted phage terminase large subunit-like protein